MSGDLLAHPYERQGKPQCKSNSNLSQVQQLITGFIMHLFFNTKLASFCKKTFVDIFLMRDLHNKERYLA